MHLGRARCDERRERAIARIYAGQSHRRQAGLACEQCVRPCWDSICSIVAYVCLVVSVSQVCGWWLHVSLRQSKACTLPATDVEPQLAEKIMSTNVVGAMRLVHYLHKQVVAARGIITLIGSVCGIAPAPWLSVYNASKAALHQYGNTLRLEMEPLK